MAKEGYKPTAGMQSAARKAIKYKEQGKAKGAGTAVGWTRAGQLARGESLSLDTVKRMYSFFSRHEVDKKGKDWDNTENPSNGRIMWLAWGGDAGFAWSRTIVNREKKAGEMSKFMNNGISEEIKSILNDVIDPITIEKAVKPEVSKDTLLEVIKELQEIIVGMVEVEEMDTETESESPELEVEDANPAPIGDPEKNDINWPVAKVEGQLIINEKEREILDEANDEPVKKSLWTGSLDPVDFAKRKFSAESRRRMAESGNAMPDGSYPIGNRSDLENAIRSWGRGGSDPKVKSHIKRRAKELGAEDMIPENWK